MDRKVCLTLLALLGVLLAPASPVVAGGMKAAFAGSPGSSWSGDAAALGRLMSTRLEDGVAPELALDLEVHRRILATNIGPRVFNPNRPACPGTGSCAGRGNPYTPSRGCLKIYQCRS
ncbi:hypothetical protein PAHAL_7G112800 [Panicum hallii]|uniref:Uncharacterized protein n=1 Tax=Panicum hallii TaxID=206008 RepID=A0A2T8IBX9_9POAL|nr:uncharacterized protein LOC112901105 [Panicum hallii]PVH35156.1 hypothetical protein PAHAL_7G112800 [Panicum hallii]